MSAANKTLAELFDLITGLVGKKPTARQLSQLDDYISYTGVNPEKATEALQRYTERPDTYNLLISPIGRVANWDNPHTQDVLEQGWRDAKFMAPQFRNWFRDSVITEPNAPRVRLDNTYDLTVPELQYQGARSPIDFIDDAKRNLTAPDGFASDNKTGGIWTGTPYGRAWNYAFRPKTFSDGTQPNRDGVVNKLYVRMRNPLVIDADGRRWYDIGSSKTTFLPEEMRMLTPSEIADAQLMYEFSDGKKFIDARNTLLNKGKDWWERTGEKQLDDNIKDFITKYKNDEAFKTLKSELEKSGTTIEKALKTNYNWEGFSNELFDAWELLMSRGAFRDIDNTKWRRQMYPHNSYYHLLMKNPEAQNAQLYLDKALLGNADTLYAAMRRAGYEEPSVGASGFTRRIDTDQVSKFVKNELDDVDGVVMDNIRDGADEVGDMILARNVVPNTNQQVKRADGNFTFNPRVKEWSKGVVGAGTAGYLGSKMVAPTEAQAFVQLPPSQGLGESWNPIESMLVGAGTGALAGAGAAGIGAIPGAVGGALGGLLFDGLMEAGVPYVYNNYIEPSAKEYAKNFVFTPPVLED